MKVFPAMTTRLNTCEPLTRCLGYKVCASWPSLTHDSRAHPWPLLEIMRSMYLAACWSLLSCRSRCIEQPSPERDLLCVCRRILKSPCVVQIPVDSISLLPFCPKSDRHCRAPPTVSRRSSSDDCAFTSSACAPSHRAPQPPPGPPHP